MAMTRQVSRACLYNSRSVFVSVVIFILGGRVQEERRGKGHEVEVKGVCVYSKYTTSTSWRWRNNSRSQMWDFCHDVLDLPRNTAGFIYRALRQMRRSRSIFLSLSFFPTFTWINFISVNHHFFLRVKKQKKNTILCFRRKKYQSFIRMSYNLCF